MNDIDTFKEYLREKNVLISIIIKYLSLIYDILHMTIDIININNNRFAAHLRKKKGNIIITLSLI